jgi:hypothetical protein
MSQHGRHQFFGVTADAFLHLDVDGEDVFDRAPSVGEIVPKLRRARACGSRDDELRLGYVLIYLAKHPDRAVDYPVGHDEQVLLEGA